MEGNQEIGRMETKRPESFVRQRVNSILCFRDTRKVRTEGWSLGLAV